MRHFGIETMYRNRKYRSRLEARWAAFFDLAGWQYEYEPFDLHGWIPDFILLGAENVLVEIKPATKEEDFPIAKCVHAMVDTPYYGTELLLLGLSIVPLDNSWPDASRLGWIGEGWGTILDPPGSPLPWRVGMGIRDPMSEYAFDEAVLHYLNQQWDFCSDTGSFRDRLTGIYEGGHKSAIPPRSLVRALWNQAGNEVQWRK